MLLAVNQHVAITLVIDSLEFGIRLQGLNWKGDHVIHIDQVVLEQCPVIGINGFADELVMRAARLQKHVSLFTSSLCRADRSKKSFRVDVFNRWAIE